MTRTVQTEQQFFDDPVHDRLLAICMTLASELWVTRSRLMDVESLLQNKGVITKEQLEKMAGEQPQQRQAALDAFADGVMAALQGKQASRGAGPDILDLFK